MSDKLDGAASGYMCPQCGGALWEQGDGATRAFECRIGHRLEAAQLWIEHAAARNRALQHAVRAMAEHAALARGLVTWAHQRGETALAARLQDEAADEERLVAQVRAMLDELPIETPRDAGAG